MTKIIVAHAFRTYREACAEALRLRRPAIDVEAVDPEQLEQILKQETPDLLIVSGMPLGIRNYHGTWLLLYPQGSNHGVVCRGNVQVRTVENFDLSDLLEIVDQLRQSETGVKGGR